MLEGAALGRDPQVPVYACEGFEPPMNLAALPPAMGGGVIARTVADSRVLPFKATLVDSNANLVTIVSAAPRIEVRPDEQQDGPEAEVVQSELLSGSGSTGNAFELSGTTWRFNLRASGFNLLERYTATMVSGDPNEYRIDPTCEAVFLVR